MSLDAFWAHIDNQIEELRSARTVYDVLRICPRIPGTSSGDGFFGGGGGDVLPNDPLSEAGWEYVWVEAHYYWCMQAPGGGSSECCCRGDLHSPIASCPECVAGMHSDCWKAGGMITYVEGDLYRGNQHPSKAGR